MKNTFAFREEFHLLKHPFYQAWMEGKLTHNTLQDYVRQYYHHVEAFPRYLQNALAICDAPETRAILAENLSEEDGTKYGTSHPELWLRFAEGLGVSREETKTAPLRSGIEGVVGTFQGASRASLAKALGALYAYECQVPEIAASKIEGLKQHFGVADARSLEFFEVHKKADIEHRESILALINRLPEEERAEAQQAADQASQSLWNFLSDVHHQSQCA